jgi:hypothetical protein
MDAKDKTKLEGMASDLIKALKLGDIDTALQFFHPDERAETEEMLRDGGLEGTVEDLPEGDPEFAWSKTNDGTPSLDVANAQVDMSWLCVFRDGRWWLE